ncbi:capsid cement protein [Nocardia sp. NPDC051981]|uniref:capsid cement protein n=1 Tax=Nocardia sp. NPDC051981 TaxID=3155417 RepID=UPI003422B7C1
MPSTPLTNPRVYAPGADITAVASTAVTGRRFVAISGNRSGGNLSVAHATAAGRKFGVAKHDAAAGALVGVARDGVVWVRAAGTIAAFAEVEVGASGQVVAKSAGVAVGYAVTGAASGADAEIVLYP